MNFVLKNLIIVGLKYASDEFLNKDFAKKYDEDILFEILSINMVLSLANGIERQEISNECIKKVICLLHSYNVNESEISIPKHFISIDEFMSNCKDFVDCEYEFRYRFLESLLYIFFYNGKNIKNYSHFIKLASFLELKKSDFIYLINKYKGVK